MFVLFGNKISFLFHMVNVSEKSNIFRKFKMQGVFDFTLTFPYQIVGVTILVEFLYAHELGNIN